MKAHPQIDTEPITINKPVVIIPAEEYMELLKEAGYRSTPTLSRAIAQARIRFRKGRYTQWKKLKNELLQHRH